MCVFVFVLHILAFSVHKRCDATSAECALILAKLEHVFSVYVCAGAVGVTLFFASPIEAG